MLFDASGNSENVWVEDDVLGWKANLINKDVVGSFTDTTFVFVGGGLTLFVEGHDDNGCTIVKDVSRVGSEGFFSFLERDGVDDALSLKVFEAFLNDFPFR